MRKSDLCKVFAGIGISVTLFTSCVDDTNLDMPPVPDQSFVEQFDTTSAALQRGWRFINSSVPKGPNIWQQGGSVVPWFSAYSNNGSNVGFIGADYTSTSLGVISNWVVSPAVTMQNGDKIIFYTRSAEDLAFDPVTNLPNGDSTDYGNRLQVRINANNNGLNVGSGINAGDFTKLILDINPTYVYSSWQNPVANAYPTRWTRFEATVFGLSQPTTGRFAFRYFVENGGVDLTGATVANGNAVAIDYVTYKSVGH